MKVTSILKGAYGAPTGTIYTLNLELSNGDVEAVVITEKHALEILANEPHEEIKTSDLFTHYNFK